MSNIAFKCDCGWMAVEDPDDMWDDVSHLVDQHVEHCPKNENDPVIRQDTGAVRANPSPLQEEQMTTKNPTVDSTHPDALWHPAWCDPSSCHADPQEPTDVSHASTTTSTGRSWDRTTGEWKAEAQLNLLEWGDDEPRQVYVVVRFNDEEDVNLYEHDLTQLIGFLETTRTRLFQAAGKDGGEAR